MPLAFWRRRAPIGSPHQRLSRGPHVLVATQGDETVLLDTQRERYFTLDAVGSRVWTLLAHGATTVEIAATLRAEYEMPAGTESDPIDGDVTRLVTQLREAGLVIAAEARP